MFSKVFKVRHKIDHCTYALKRSHISVKHKRGQKQLAKEVKIFCSLSHRNVVKYCTSFLDVKDSLCILMEYCAKDLAKCFQNQLDMQNLIKPRFGTIFNDIISGLEYIHAQHIIHGDLRPANIFLSSLDSTCHVKVGDFGLSCFQDQSAMSYIGSARYQAPEQSLGMYDCKADMFSAGIILFELAKLDWEDLDDETDYWGKVLKKLRFKTTNVLQEFRPFHPQVVKTIIISLLKKDPSERPSASQVKEELGEFVADTKCGKNSGTLF